MGVGAVGAVAFVDATLGEDLDETLDETLGAMIPDARIAVRFVRCTTHLVNVLGIKIHSEPGGGGDESR